MYYKLTKMLCFSVLTIHSYFTFLFKAMFTEFLILNMCNAHCAYIYIASVYCYITYYLTELNSNILSDLYEKTCDFIMYAIFLKQHIFK